MGSLTSECLSPSLSAELRQGNFVAAVAVFLHQVLDVASKIEQLKRLAQRI